MPAAKKVIVKKATVKKVVAPPALKVSGLSIDVYGTTGKVVGKMSLPKEIFGASINKPLMAQAVRVFLANQRQGTSSTKTRGEVDGSTRKIYKQKGTGRARHGGIRAPIFVGGGVALGPKPRDHSLKLPQKMRKVAVVSALSAKFKDGEIKILSDLSKIEPKTKVMANLIKIISPKSKRILLVTSGSPKEGLDSLYKAGRNLKNLDIVSANLLNTYEILKSREIYMMKQAVEVMEKSFERGK